MDLLTIKNWFRRGLKPTEAQFAAVFDSFRHKDDPVPMGDVDGLSYALANKSENGHTHTLAEITDYDGGDKEVLNAMVADDTAELEAFTKTIGMYYILLETQTLYRYVHDEDTDTDTLTEVEPDGKVVYSAYDADDNLHIFLYNVPYLEFQDVTNEQVDKTIYTNDLDTLITKQLENGIYAVVCLVSQQGNAYCDSYTLTVGDSGSTPNRVIESRDGWAQTVLSNGSYQWEWHRYSYEGHTHNYAAASHTHAIADVTGLQTALDANAGTPTLTIPDTTLAQTLAPNTLYIFTDRTNNLTLTLGEPLTGKVAEYHCLIIAGATAPTITYPNGITWNGGNPPTIAANYIYELSILESVAAFFEVEPITQS